MTEIIALPVVSCCQIEKLLVSQLEINLPFKDNNRLP
jgi:hypothetical protein